MNGRPIPSRTRTRGMALLCSLLLLLATMTIGLAATRLTFAAMQSARFGIERAVAYGAADAALRDAERDIAGAGPPARAVLLSPAGAPAWPAGCGHGDADRGLCALQTPPAWQTLDLAAPDQPVPVTFGAFTGAVMATGAASLPARLPAYVIERLSLPGTYRVTAIGFGPRAMAPVVLQVLVRSADPGAPTPEAQSAGQSGGQSATPTTAASGRIAMREIADWAALHAKAQP